MTIAKSHHFPPLKKKKKKIKTHNLTQEIVLLCWIHAHNTFTITSGNKGKNR